MKWCSSRRPQIHTTAAMHRCDDARLSTTDSDTFCVARATSSRKTTSGHLRPSSRASMLTIERRLCRANGPSRADPVRHVVDRSGQRGTARRGRRERRPSGDLKQRFAPILLPPSQLRRVSIEVLPASLGTARGEKSSRPLDQIFPLVWFDRPGGYRAPHNKSPKRSV
jgi:hypothetical protein